MGAGYMHPALDIKGRDFAGMVGPRGCVGAPILQRTLRVGGIFMQGSDGQLSGCAYASLASPALRPRYNRCGLRFLGVAAGQAAGLVGLCGIGGLRNGSYWKA